MNTPSTIAETAVRSVAAVLAGRNPVVPDLLDIMPEAATGRHDQCCVAAFLPWEWEAMPTETLAASYLEPLAARLAAPLPPDFGTPETPMELPEQTPSALASYGRVTLRAVIASYAVTKRSRVSDTARVMPWYNIDLNLTEQRAVLPCLRLDVRFSVAADVKQAA